MYEQTRADLKSNYFRRKLVIYSFPTEHKYKSLDLPDAIDEVLKSEKEQG